jgi:ubiquinone biosynthesis protein COQ4
MRGTYDSAAIMEFDLALEGDDGEAGFHEFLADPDAASLLKDRPCLARLLDDAGALSRMSEGSFGRTYLALAQRDGIRASSLVEGAWVLPDEQERAPDPVRRWYRDRMTATHDLLHVLTGYDRDRAGETALIAFSLGLHPMRVFKVSLLLALLSAPKRQWVRLIPYLHRAWRRGKRAHIPRATAWEELLPLPVAMVRQRLGIAPVEQVHPMGVWRQIPGSRQWQPTNAATGWPSSSPKPAG